MKILFINGSPRNGNSLTAIDILRDRLRADNILDISLLNAYDTEITSCIACELCKDSGKCVFEDDTNSVIDRIVEADALIISTPVYWWGIPAQLKLIIDKFYSRQSELASSNKKVGLIMCGQLSTDNIQYRLITDQIKSICDYLNWSFIFHNAYEAYGSSDLLKNDTAIDEIKMLSELLR